jgi:hypothetical protein
MPWWAWLIIAYLGYEDIYRLLSGYSIIIAIIILAAYGVLKATGMSHMPVSMINMVYNTVLSNKK